MNVIDVIKSLNLTTWEVLLVGWKKGWLTRVDIIGYSVKLLQKKEVLDDENIALIASADHSSDDEFFQLLTKQVNQEKPTSNSTALDIWRLAFLISLSQSSQSSEEKLEKLQEIYSQFDYPGDMASCSIYSQGEVSPLLAMQKSIESLKSKLLISS